MAKFDVLKDGQAIQSGVDSPIMIDGLKPATQYDNYSIAYAGKADATPLSFKTAVQAVTGVTLDKTEVSLEVGKTAQLVATVAPADATDKSGSWKSGNTEVFTVDAEGVVTGVKAGSAHLVFTTTDGAKTAQATITVTEPASA